MSNIKVKLWITINEPSVMSINGHGTGEHAPGFTEIGTYVYEVSHHTIRAHAKAYRLYQNEFSHQNGKTELISGVNNNITH